MHEERLQKTEPVGGASGSPDQASLPKLHHVARFTVIGPSKDLNRALQRLLLDEAVETAIKSLMPPGSSEITVRETKTRVPVCSSTAAGTFSIELPPKFRAASLKNSLLVLATVELAIRDLSELAKTNTLRVGAKEDLLRLTRSVSAQPISGDHDLRAAFFNGVKQYDSLILERIDRHKKRLGRLGTSPALPDLKAANDAVDELFRSLSALRALSWLSRSGIDHEAFCEVGESAVLGTVGSLGQLWERALGSDDFNTAHSLLETYGRLLTSLQSGSFDKLPPQYYLPLDSDPEAGALTTQAKIHRLLNRRTGSLQTLRTFAPAALQELPDILPALRRSLDLLQTGARWTTTDPSPTHAIFEEMIKCLHGAAIGASALKETLPAELPQDLSCFVEVLTRLRYLQDDEGLKSFHLITSSITTLEERDDIMERPLYFAQTRVRDLLNLVEFVASWSGRSSAIKVDLVSGVHTSLSETIGRALGLIVSNYMATTSKCLTERQTLEAQAADELLADVAIFRATTKEILPHVKNPLLEATLRGMRDTSLEALERTVRALRGGPDSAEARLRRAIQLPDDFSETPVDQALKIVCDEIRSETFLEAEQTLSRLSADLSASFFRGDVEAFSEQLRDTLALLDAMPHSHELRSRHFAGTDELTLKCINLVLVGFNDELSSVSARMASNQASGKDIASALDSLRLQLSQFAALRAAMRAREAVLPPARHNHLNNSIVAAVDSSRALAALLIGGLAEELQSTPSEETLQVALLLQNTHGTLDRIRDLAPREVAKLRQLLRDK